MTIWRTMPITGVLWTPSLASTVYTLKYQCNSMECSIISWNTIHGIQYQEIHMYNTYDNFTGRICYRTNRTVVLRRPFLSVHPLCIFAWWVTSCSDCCWNARNFKEWKKTPVTKLFTFRWYPCIAPVLNFLFENFSFVRWDAVLCESNPPLRCNRNSMQAAPKVDSFDVHACWTHCVRHSLQKQMTLGK